ncbi:MAG TPA: ATPase, partial [Streptomyces sp.]|nr:ATPase [Streptomyces sp.]
PGTESPGAPAHPGTESPGAPAHPGAEAAGPPAHPGAEDSRTAEGPGTEAVGTGSPGMGPERQAARPGGSSPAAQPATPHAEFRRDGAVWALAFAGRIVHVPDAKGLRDLHTLLGHPGDDLPAVVLLDPAGGEAVVAAARFGADPVLDEEAKARYRRRLERLDVEIDRAGELGDDRRAAEFDRERSALLDELRTAAGLGGRTRRLGDEAERARKTVTARIRDTLRKLDALHPELAAHLRESVGTGSSCSYRPSRGVDWRL